MKDIAWFYFLLNEKWIFDDIGNPLPSGPDFEVLHISNRRLIGWKLMIREILPIFFVFLDEFQIVWFQNFADVDLLRIVVIDVSEGIVPSNNTCLGYIPDPVLTLPLSLPLKLLEMGVSAGLAVGFVGVVTWVGLVGAKPTRGKEVMHEKWI